MIQLTGRYWYAIKLLSAVESSRADSNQHELNGSSALRALLGDIPRRQFPTRWIFLDDAAHVRVEEYSCSWYDARASHETRSEWRLYYSGEPSMCEGDLLVCLKREGEETITFLQAPGGSSWSEQIRGLLGQPNPRTGSFATASFAEIPPTHESVASQIFELTGWLETKSETSASDVERLRSRFGDGFPRAEDFSSFARELAPMIPADPDATLMKWWRKEEQLFRALEEVELSERLRRRPPFAGVEDFVGYSLSVLNRRKSRAGRALESHVAALLRARSIRFSRQKATEGGRRPDFILPGIAEYLRSSFPADHLTILATKTTCKDRWRQVLNEAARVPAKHLLTLEPGISAQQLSEMCEERVHLVVAKELLPTYKAPFGMRILTIADFLDFVEEKERVGQA